MKGSKGRNRTGGGGHDRSLMALAVLGVMMMAAVIGMVAMDGEHSADAAVGDQITVGDLIYEVIADGELEVADTTSTSISGAMTIPSSVSDGSKQYNVTTIGERAFSSCSGLTSVTIPDSVTSIGERAFYYCSSMTSINVGSGNPNYSSLNGVLFNKDVSILIACPNGLQGEYEIPDSVTSIGDYAFYYCSGLTSVTIPDSVKSIGFYAFSSCSRLTSVTIPDSVTSIRESMFSGCTSLTSVTIPDSVKSIGAYAFSSCYGLTSVIIGNSVTSIGFYAFRDCSGLTSVTIPDSVKSIDGSAFNNCTGLTSVTIGNSVTSIGNYAFYGCYGLTSVIIGNSVTSIGESAFNNCTGLTSVTIPDSVTSIRYSAFKNCTGLTSVTFLSQEPPSFGDQAFNTRTALNVSSQWDPVSAMADAIGTSGTTVVWAGTPYSDLIFTSDPSTGTIIFAART